MGRPRIFETVEQLEEVWEKYKDQCDNKKVLFHEFSSKDAKYISARLKHGVTYTIEGFCVFAGISRSKFYADYADTDEYRDTVTCMREECEVDARTKFELGIVPPQLAGLWMSNYGYTTKTEGNVQVKNSVKIVDDLDG